MLHCFGTIMVFTKRLRDGVRCGVITCSVRIWKSPHVKVGGRYRMEEGGKLWRGAEIISEINRRGICNRYR